MVNRLIVLALLIVATATFHGSATRAADLSDDDIARYSRDVIFGDLERSRAALDALVQRGEKDVVPTLVLALRYRRGHTDILKAASTLAGERLAGWQGAMLWQEGHPEIVPHPSYRPLKLDIFKRLDPNFLRFVGGEKSKAENLDIRFEEITWGGVSVDGIPSLDNPKLVDAGDAGYLADNDLVFGVEINGDARAYPLRVMGWHEMFNEVIGGVPVALAYCTLCGAGILFETSVQGRKEPFIFGSSGFLYRSNKLMFDRETDSLWNQFTGKPVSGKLRGSGITLKTRPVAITSWSAWKAANPTTKALSLDTGHDRDYGSGVVYQDYFASPDLMFPTIVRDESIVKRKDYVFGIRDVGVARAWPVDAFEDEPVINDAIGTRNIVLIGNPNTRTVRAYDRGDRMFSSADKDGVLTGPGGTWTLAENALKGPNGETLARIPGHVSYWFAWDGYFGADSTLYTKASNH